MKLNPRHWALRLGREKAAERAHIRRMLRLLHIVQATAKAGRRLTPS